MTWAATDSIEAVARVFLVTSAAKFCSKVLALWLSSSDDRTVL